MQLKDLVNLFRKQYSANPLVMAEAPGRVNLLGEHTDYNDGFVFPTAIDRSMKILAAPSESDTVRVYSADFREASEFTLSSIKKSGSASWSNYLRGVVDQLIKRDFAVKGGNYVIKGNVPVGAGLSSSAAYEVAAVAACREMFALDMDNVQLALIAQAAEREFVGVQCGIMDQFVSANAGENSALFLDCRDLSYQNVPLDETVSIVVCDSDVPRELNNSAYNDRRAECEESARILAGVLPNVSALRDVSPAGLEGNRNLLSPLLYRRAAHVITENQRVLQGIDCLKKRDIPGFGSLLYESHSSLRDMFEVSCPELDLLVELASDTDGVLGSRMTGAGFGGCTVSLVEAGKVQEFIEHIKPAYDKATGRTTIDFSKNIPVLKICSTPNRLFKIVGGG